jgi:nucleotide-binding universal stress UspA family protein
MVHVMKILVPVDLSGNSDSAMRYASKLAAITGAKVYLFHTSILPDFYVTELDDYSRSRKEMKAVIKRIQDASMTFLQEMRKRFFPETARVVCKITIAKNIYNEILNYADELMPDYIIMGGGEQSGKIKIGSNTERVLRLTDIPVLVVKNPAKASKTNKVVFASDFYEDSVSVFPQINEFIGDSRASVRLLYVNTKSKFEEYETVKARIENFKRNFSADFNIVIRAGKSVETSIVRYANSINADLIAMGMKRKKGLSLYFTDKITESVISLSDIPVLAVYNPGKI